MSLLALQLPPRQRLGPRAAGADAALGAAVPAQWFYSHSTDGKRAGAGKSTGGEAATALLPAAEQVVLVVAAADVSWHRVRVPKAPASRMRAALLGLLEEQLLEDENAVHLALAADAKPGTDTWVAATHAPYLAAALAALQSAGVHVARVVSALPPPGGPLRAHFSSMDEAGLPGAETAPAGAAQAGEVALTLSAETGAWQMPLAAGATAAASTRLVEALRQAQPTAVAQQCWTATPRATAAAQRFLGRPVPVQSTAEHLLEAAESSTNLRQFELAPQHRGLAALGAATRQLRTPQWRTVRWGLATLVGLQLLGLNVAAWSQQRTLQTRRADVDQLLRSAHPGVKVVLDAPLQMRSETERLRAAAGRPGPADLEAALAQAAAAWPEGKTAVQALRFEAGRLSLSSPGWNEAEQAAFRDRLQAAGWAVNQADGLVAITRAGAR